MSFSVGHVCAKAMLDYCKKHPRKESVSMERGICEDICKEVFQLESENARLRKAIEAAPHGKWCRARGICECWKSKALGEQK